MLQRSQHWLILDSDDPNNPEWTVAVAVHRCPGHPHVELTRSALRTFKEDDERVQLRLLQPGCNRRILLHHPTRSRLVLGVDHDEAERPVEAATREANDAAGVEFLEVGAVPLEEFMLLGRRRGKKLAVERRAQNVGEGHDLE